MSKESVRQTMTALAGIDQQIGLDNVLGDKSLFVDVLVMFYQDHGQDIDKIAQAIKNNDDEQAKHLVHTLKGVSASIGAMALFDAAKALESAFIHQEQQQYHRLFDVVTKKLEQVLSGIQQQFGDKL